MGQTSGKCFKPILAIFYSGAMTFVRMSHCCTFMTTDRALGRNQTHEKLASWWHFAECSDMVGDSFDICHHLRTLLNVILLKVILKSVIWLIVIWLIAIWLIVIGLIVNWLIVIWLNAIPNKYHSVVCFSAKCHLSLCHLAEHYFQTCNFVNCHCAH